MINIQSLVTAQMGLQLAFDDFINSLNECIEKEEADKNCSLYRLTSTTNTVKVYKRQIELGSKYLKYLYKKESGK